MERAKNWTYTSLKSFQIDNLGEVSSFARCYQLSKWPFAKTYKVTETKTFTNFSDNAFTTYGVPKIIGNDIDTAFEGKDFKGKLPKVWKKNRKKDHHA